MEIKSFGVGDTLNMKKNHACSKTAKQMLVLMAGSDVKVKCIEGDVTQARLAEEIGTSAPYVSRLIRNNEKIVNKTFLQLMEKLGYDVELTYVKREEK